MIIRTHEEWVKQQEAKKAAMSRPDKCPCCGSTDMKDTWLVYTSHKTWEIIKKPIYECNSCHTQFTKD